MIWYLNLSEERVKSNHLSFALSLLKNFSLAILAQCLISTSQEQLVFYNQIVQGVCSCFSLFNLQGTPCFALGNTLGRNSLDIISRPSPFVKHFFQKISKFFIFFFGPIFSCPRAAILGHLNCKRLQLFN